MNVMTETVMIEVMIDKERVNSSSSSCVRETEKCVSVKEQVEYKYNSNENNK